VTRTAALLATAILAIVLMGWGAAHAPIGQRRTAVPRPAVLPVRVMVLNPTNGAVIWSSVALPTRVVVDPATGKEVTAGASTSAP
jgi:hypothetical protein